MTAPHTKVPDLVDQLATAATDARTALSELRSELKEARRELREIEAERARIRDMFAEDAGKLVETAMKAQVDTSMAQVVAMRDVLIDKIDKVTQRYLNLCMYGNEQGRGVNIFDELRASAQDRLRELGS
jgi:flagellar biosynthesis chaperone FliJ